MDELDLRRGTERAQGRYRARSVAAVTKVVQDPFTKVTTWLHGHTPVVCIDRCPSRSPSLGIVRRACRRPHRVELQRPVKQGHLEDIGSWEDVVSKFEVLVSKTSDGMKKVRSIPYALHNGTDGIMRVKEP